MTDSVDRLGDEIFGNSTNGMPPGIAELLAASQEDNSGDPIGYHDGAQILFPRGMTTDAAKQVIARHERQAEMLTSWDRQFHYRPDDGAHAMRAVLLRRYGIATGDSKTIQSFFGETVNPSQMRDVIIGLNEHMQVPWGYITIPQLPELELLMCDEHPHPKFGKVFELHVSGPQKYAKIVERLFKDIEQELREHSIYRGKALRGARTLEFMDTSFDDSQIVFSDEVMRRLEAQLWTPIRYPDAVLAVGIDLKRTVLLHGPFGTGKTSAAMITAKIAIEKGWTFLAANPSDSIEDVLAVAALYDRTVVVYEDIERVANNNDDGIAGLLDAFDGITAKGQQRILILTTNKQKKIPKGLLRPGRIDAEIEVAGLDKGGIMRLLPQLIQGSRLSPTIDYDQVAAAMAGFLPAFVSETADTAQLYAISRMQGSVEYTITTEDLVAAAETVHSLLDAHNEASSDSQSQTLGEAFEASVRGVVDGAKVMLTYDKGTISVEDKGEN